MEPQHQGPLRKLLLAMVLLSALAARAWVAPPPAGEVGPESVAWRAVDASGRPVAGAVVWEMPPAVPRLYLGEVFPPPVRWAVSAEDGRFSIPAAVPYRTDFTICRDGYLPRSLPSTFGEPPFAVVLRRPARISGRVLAPDGSPVKGAKVSARILQWFPPSDLIPCEGPTPEDQVPKDPCSAPAGDRTDARGRFSLSLAAGSYGISAIAAGYRRAYVDDRFTLAEGQEVAGVEMRLARGESVRGRVTTPAGEPVAGAEVSTNQDDSSAVTDARGDYRLEGLWPGRQTIRAKVGTKDDFLPRDTSREIVVAAGENGLDLTLPPLAEGREVRGQVLAPDGTPVAGALLARESAARPNDCSAGRGPRTAADGSFAVHLPAGIDRLVAAHPGYSPAALDLPAEGKPVAGAVIRLAPDLGISVRIQGWEPGGRAWGIWLDPAGEPRNPGRSMLSGDIGPDGRYLFGGLSPGDWVVGASIEDHELSGRVKLAPGAEAHLDLALPPKLTVHGRVVDEHGRPVAGAKVTFHGGQWWESPATSAADGAFSVRVESGTWPAKVEWGGFAPVSKPVEVAGPTPRPVEIAVPRGAVLRLRFRGIPAGQALQGLEVVAEKPSFRRATIAWGSEEDHEEGVQPIPGLPPGDWRIEAEIGPAPVPDEYRPYQMKAVRRVTIKPDDREVTFDLVLPRGGLTLSGHIANADRPLDVILRRLDDPTAELIARPAYIDGPFRFTGLPAGKYHLMTADPGTGDLITSRDRDLELVADREVVLGLN